MAHVAPWKYEFVEKLEKLICEYSMVGVVNIENIPAAQMQKMRANLMGKSLLIVGKNRLIKLALQKADEKKKGIIDLANYVDGQTALIFAKTNPFKLIKLLDASKTPSPAKGGEIAPEDIVVPAGETQFKPGPVISEFQRVGLPAAVQKGKIVIREDTILVKKGEKISREIAQVLTKLEIYPLTVGLDLRAAYEDGMVFPRDILEVSTEKVQRDLLSAIQSAINLSVNVAYPTPLTIGILISTAHMNAMNLAINACVVNKETISIVLSKAYSQMLSLASSLKDGLDDELKGLITNAHAVSEEKHEKKEEEKKEEKKEEEEEKKEEEAIAGLGSLFG